MTEGEASIILNRMKDESLTKETFEALELAIDALEKQIPKETIKPDSPYFKYACPACGNYPLSGKYCCECGQAVVYKEGE